MSTVAAQTDRRFRRAHVKPARRKRSWRAIVKPVVMGIVLAAVLLYGAYRTSAIAGHLRMLEVETITVRGNVRLSRGEVLAVLNGLRGESLVWTDLHVWRKRLLAWAAERRRAGDSLEDLARRFLVRELVRNTSFGADLEAALA